MASQRVSDSLSRKLGYWRNNFNAATGNGFAHFFCPILLKDEDTELCEGHIVNKALRGSTGKKVPQRRDVDNFFGSAVEAPFFLFLRHVKKPWEEFVTDPEAHAEYVHLEYKGRRITHYISRGGRVPNGYSRLVLSFPGNHKVEVVVRLLPEWSALDEIKLDVVREADLRAEMVASLIKAGYLSLFWMLGYEFVFSLTGQFVSGILAGFYGLKPRGGHRVPKREIARYFEPYVNMVRPLAVVPDGFKGTVEDRQVLVSIDARNRPFAVGVIVRIADQFHWIAFPDSAIKNMPTFHSFLREPPPSIRLKVAQFSGSHWDMSADDPIEVPFAAHSLLDVPRSSTSVGRRAD